jgi:hypothetical protein
MGNKYLLCNRVGSANAQKQTHREGNVAPVTRGIWAFPWPYNDYFFSFHIAEKYKKKSDEYVSGDLWKRLKKNEMKTKQIKWNKPFYSHLKPDPKLPPARWYLWENCVGFEDAVETSLYYWEDNRRGKYSIDHLEIFLPMKGGFLPKIIY